MDDRAFVLRRDRLGQPFDQPVHFRYRLGFGQAVLLGPARYLAGAVILRLAEIVHADLCRVRRVEIGHGVDHRVIDRAAILLRDAGERPVPQGPPIGEPHDEEHRSDDVRILAKAVGLRHRKPRRPQRRHRLVFAVNRMRARQQFTEGLAAQDVAAVRGVDPIGWIGLAALELRIGYRPFEAFDIGLEPCRQPVEVERVGIRHCDRADHLLVEIDRLRGVRRVRHQSNTTTLRAEWPSRIVSKPLLMSSSGIRSAMMVSRSSRPRM